MSRLVKIVDNKYVQIEEHKSPNICFNTNEYDDFEDYCTLRETFDPFEMFYENQELKKQLENYKKLGFKYLQDKNNNLENQQKEFIEYLENEITQYGGYKLILYKEILSKYKEIIGDVKSENK